MNEQTSLFGRVTRYVMSDVVDPRENRLTEVLASAIGAVDGLGLRLSMMWLDTPPHDGSYGDAEQRKQWDIKLADVNQKTLNWLKGVADAHENDQPTVEVQTQKQVGGKFVDLEMRFTERGGSEQVLRVEIKHHGFGVHDQQLFAYANRIGRVTDIPSDLPADTSLVLLAPSESVPQPKLNGHEIPVGLPQCSWQVTGRVARDFGRERFGSRFPLEVGSGSPAGAYLLAQFVQYLREESLMARLDALDLDHVNALEKYGDAADGLVEVLDAAVRLVEQGWGPADTAQRGSKPERGDWFRQFAWEQDPAAVERVPQWLEFKIARAGSIERNVEADGLDSNTLVVIAGWSSLTKDGLEAPSGSQEHMQFQEGSCSRLMRMKPLAELLGEASSGGAADLESQGQYLGEWVAQSFAGLGVDG